MGFFNLVFSLVLFGFGGLIVWYLGGLLFRALKRAFSSGGFTTPSTAGSAGGAGSTGGIGSAKAKKPVTLRGAAKQLKLADDLAEEKKYKKALKTLNKSLFLDKAPSEPKLGAIKEHHQNILSRFLTISELQGTRIPNLQKLESLLLKHSDLNADSVGAKLSYQKLKSRREKHGKDIPDWSKKDFKKKIKELKIERNKNIKELKKELSVLYAALNSPPPKEEESDVTYH